MNRFACLLLFAFFIAACTSCAEPEKSKAADAVIVPKKGRKKKVQDSDTLSGRAVKIVDGDTFDLLVDDTMTVRIRMSGIDAPEKSQPFGQKSKAAIGDLLDGPPLMVIIREKDRYGRAVCDVYRADGTWINLALVQGGWAWHYTDYSKDERIAAAEQTARAAKEGLWADARPTPPWEYRKEKRSPKKGARTTR